MAESAPSPTDDIEEEEESEAIYAYVFLISYGEEGLYVDDFLDVSEGLGDDVCAKAEAVDKLMNTPGVRMNALKKLQRRIEHMFLRARIGLIGVDNPGPFLVKAPQELTRHSLEAIIRSMKLDRRREFFASAKF